MKLKIQNLPNKTYVATYKTKPYIALEGVGQGDCSNGGTSKSAITFKILCSFYSTFFVVVYIKATGLMKL